MTFLLALLLSQAGLQRWQPGRQPDSDFRLFTQYSFTAPGTLPSAVVPSGLVMLCTANAGGTAWQCVDGAGASFGTVTQGTGSTFQDTPFSGRKALSDTTSAQAPQVAATALDPLWKTDHTIIMAGYGTGKTNATFQHWTGLDDGTRSVTARGEGSNFNCIYFENPAVVTAAVVANGVDGWAVQSCRRDGANYIARSNGSDGTPVTGATIVNNITAGTKLFMGDRPTAGLPMRGPLAFLAVYSRALTNTELLTIERSWWGVDSRVSAVATGVCADPDGGAIDCYFSGAAITGPAGLAIQRGDTSTNPWAADPLDVTTWTAVGTPTATSNASAGPFFRWKQQNECDLVVDDDAVALEGYTSTGSAGTALGRYTASCYLKAGTSGVTTDKAQVNITTDGAGSTTCNFSGITSTATRRTCTATISGTPTFIRGQVLVGNATTDTGSITVCQCQIGPNSWAGLPQVVNTVRGNSAVSLDAVADAWPAPSNRGKYEVLFTPIYDTNSQWFTASDITYLFDVYDSLPTHTVIQLFGYVNPGVAMARTQNDPDVTELQIPGTTLNVGSLYAASIEWTPAGSGCDVKWRWDVCPGPAAGCRASTIRASASGGFCPNVPVGLKLGNRYDNTYPTDVNVSAVRIYQ